MANRCGQFQLVIKCPVAGCKFGCSPPGFDMIHHLTVEHGYGLKEASNWVQKHPLGFLKQGGETP